MDDNLKEKIALLLSRNVAIAGLRKYVEECPLIRTASFPLDLLKILIEKTIVSYMVNGISIEETKNTIDQLLNIASYYEIETEIKNKIRQ